MAGGIVGERRTRNRGNGEKYRAPDEPVSPPTQDEKARREISKRQDAWAALQEIFRS